MPCPLGQRHMIWHFSAQCGELISNICLELYHVTCVSKHFYIQHATALEHFFFKSFFSRKYRAITSMTESLDHMIWENFSYSNSYLAITTAHIMTTIIVTTTSTAPTLSPATKDWDVSEAANKVHVLFFKPKASFTFIINYTILINIITLFFIGIIILSSLSHYYCCDKYHHYYYQRHQHQHNKNYHQQQKYQLLQLPFWALSSSSSPSTTSIIGIIITYLLHILNPQFQADIPLYMLSGYMYQFLTAFCRVHHSPCHTLLMNSRVCICHLLGCRCHSNILHN